MPEKSARKQDLPVTKVREPLTMRLLAAFLMAILVIIFAGVWLALYFIFPGNNSGWYLICSGLTLLFGDLAIIIYAAFIILRLERCWKKKSRKPKSNR